MNDSRETNHLQRVKELTEQVEVAKRREEEVFLQMQSEREERLKAMDETRIWQERSETLEQENDLLQRTVVSREANESHTNDTKKQQELMGEIESLKDQLKQKSSGVDRKLLEVQSDYEGKLVNLQNQLDASIQQSRKKQERVGELEKLCQQQKEEIQRRGEETQPSENAEELKNELKRLNQEKEQLRLAKEESEENEISLLEAAEQDSETIRILQTRIERLEKLLKDFDIPLNLIYEGNM